MKNLQKITDVCDFQGGSQPPKSEWSDTFKDGYIRMLQIRDFTQDREDKQEFVKITNSIKTCEENDVLIARYGASIGKILTGLSGAYNVAIMKTIPNAQMIDRRYLLHFLKSDLFQIPIQNVGSRAAQAGFNKNDLEKVVLNLPDLDEQKRIAKILDKADEIRTKKRLANDKLDEFLKSTFISMFGDKEYKKVTIGSITLNTEQTNPAKIFDDMFYYVDIASIDNAKCVIVEPKYLNISEAPSRARKRIYNKDILVSTVRPYLRGFAIVPSYLDNQIASTGFSILRANLELTNPLFLFNYIKSEEFISQLLPKMQGASYPAVRDEDIKNVILELPPIDEQNKFAQIVEKVEAQKQKNELVIEKMDNLFNSLSQRAFKGEL